MINVLFFLKAEPGAWKIKNNSESHSQTGDKAVLLLFHLYANQINCTDPVRWGTLKESKLYSPVKQKAYLGSQFASKWKITEWEIPPFCPSPRLALLASQFSPGKSSNKELA